MTPMTIRNTAMAAVGDTSSFKKKYANNNVNNGAAETSAEIRKL